MSPEIFLPIATSARTQVPQSASAEFLALRCLQPFMNKITAMKVAFCVVLGTAGNLTCAPASISSTPRLN